MSPFKNNSLLVSVLSVILVLLGYYALSFSGKKPVPPQFVAITVNNENFNLPKGTSYIKENNTFYVTSNNLEFEIVPLHEVDKPTSQDIKNRSVFSYICGFHECLSWASFGNSFVYIHSSLDNVETDQDKLHDILKSSWKPRPPIN